MDLGIAGRKAIVCASSAGLGRACALELARAGVDVVVNGRDAAKLGETAAAIRAETGVRVTEVVGDLSTDEGRAALLAACPNPDILVNNNGGPPLKPYTELDADGIRAGVEANFVTPALLIQALCPVDKTHAHQPPSCDMARF